MVDPSPLAKNSSMVRTETIFLLLSPWFTRRCVTFTAPNSLSDLHTLPPLCFSSELFSSLILEKDKLVFPYLRTLAPTIHFPECPDRPFAHSFLTIR